MAAKEFNFDGLVGPTHNYAGLSHGNVASAKHQHAVSSPRAAALQGLEKMKFVRDLGVEQCVLPPLPRPNLNFLREIGFSGTDHQLIERAGKVDPVLVAVCFSASNMWTANAATVSPSSDTSDQKLHLTPANLASNLHRSIEAQTTTSVLRAIFADSQSFNVHAPLPSTMALTDEGAANHTRLCNAPGEAGVEVFVYGCEFLRPDTARPTKFPARQTRESVEAIARRHSLNEKQTVIIQQNPAAIDGGVFHNDVISVGHQNVLLCHEMAFADQAKSLNRIQQQFNETCGSNLNVVSISNDQLNLQDAVSSYLFNSQIVTTGDNQMALICPADCESNVQAKKCTEKILANDNPITNVHFLDLRQSMNNGGGPACLRLRVVLNDDQQSKFHQRIRFTDELHQELVDWVNKHYREELSPNDLLDPKLLTETRDAFDELGQLLDLPITSQPSI